MKIMAVCTSGLGSSFMVQMNIQNILSSEGVTDINVDHTGAGGVSPNDADYFFAEKSLADGALKNLGEDKIVKLDSLIDKNELTDKLNVVLDDCGIAHS